MSKLNKLNSHLRRWGWLRTAFFLLMRIASDFLGLHVFIVRTRSIEEKEISNPCKLPNIELRHIEENELLTFLDDAELFLDLEFVQAAIERGDLAFGAFNGSTLVAYMWRSTTSAPHTDDVWVRIAHPYSYSYKSYTRQEFRGQHLVPALILFSDEEMLKKGYTHRAGYIGVTNYPSLGMGKHVDSHSIGYIVILKWFGRHFFFRSKRVADIGFEFFEPR